MAEGIENETPAVQRRKAREQAKIRARKPQRVTYDLPPALRERVKALAGAECLPASQLVTLALLRFLKAYAEGDIALGPLKTPSRSPRYDWNLAFPLDLLKLVQNPQDGRKKSEK